MSADQNPEPVWRFIPVSDYSVPTEPPSEQIRTGLIALWGRLRRGATTLTSEQDAEDKDIDARDVEQDPRELAPWPVWTEHGIAALDEALASWRDAKDAHAGSRVLVAPPHSHIETILEAWAQRHNYRIIEPPTYGQILQNPQEWLDQLPLESGARFVLVALERCYLRHYNGLDLVRKLVHRLWQANQPCILGCDSWAWAYLDYACNISMLDRSPLTLAPLDAPAISRWIAATHATSPQADYLSTSLFRRMDSGVEVYPIHTDAPRAESAINTAANNSSGDATTDQDYKRTSEFLVHIAAHARGIPGVVWALWHKSLTLIEQSEIKDEARRTAARDPHTIWVRKWENIELPAIPSHLSDLGAFALHAILLHGGLRFEEIDYLIPGNTLQVAHDLRALESAQIVAQQEGRFYITPQGYPTVRAFLSEEAFMIDRL